MNSDTVRNVLRHCGRRGSFRIPVRVLKMT
jgi:hypothetical protein